MQTLKQISMGAALLAIALLAPAGCGPRGDAHDPLEVKPAVDRPGPTTRLYAVTSDERKLLERIRAHLAAGLDINKPIAPNKAEGLTALDAAAARRETFLHAAAREGFVEAARLLLQNGARHDVRTAAGATPLHLACAGRQVSANGRAVFLARIYGIEAARLLLAAGADVKIVDARERTPLHLACRCGDASLARLLLDKGADKNAVAMDDQGRLVMTPLLETAAGGMAMPARMASGHAATAMLLLERRAKVNLPPDGVAVPPLMWAAARGHHDLAGELVRRGAPLDAAARGGEMGKALTAAALVGEVDDWTALMAAASRGDALMVTLLLDAGADVNAGNANGQSPLSLARRHGHTAVTQILRNRGAKER